MLGRLATAAGAACAVLLSTPPDAAAQPAPSFRATCGELRAAAKRLDHDGDTLVVIEVVGALTHVQDAGHLAYLVACSPPNPQVLCVTYGTGDRKVGDTVMLTGTFSQRGPNHIQLDPCLHSPPPEEGESR